MASSQVSPDMKFLAEMVSRNDDGTYSVAQDFCYEGIEHDPGYRSVVEGEGSDEATHAVAEFARLRGVSAKILNLYGPAGGWPEVEFTGTLPAIADILYGFSPSPSDHSPSDQDKQALYSLIRNLAG